MTAIPALPVLNEKKPGLLRKKQWLTLLMNVLISVLGVTSLYEKFFLIDGVIAFRAFTVDGNLFTTVVSLIAVITSIKALITKKEYSGRTMYFLELCSAVTEAVIFIVVMVGYLPFVADTPKITPYHMFCLHVAIPVLAVARFILFDRPVGVVRPSKLMTGAIPIGVYGVCVVIAIKIGMLPTAFVPYSFLDFEHNYIWYFLFALFAIPGFGYLWAWLFYRFNMNAAGLWYKKEDVDALKESRIHSMSRFDIVNSGITIIFALLSVLLLSFSLMTNSNTSTAVEQEMMSSVSYLLLDEYDMFLGDGVWHIENGELYKGDIFVTDGTGKASEMGDLEVIYPLAIYMKASDLKPELASQYASEAYVLVTFAEAEDGVPKMQLGTTLSTEIEAGLMDDGIWYEQIKLERPLTAEEEQYKEQLRNTKEAYYHFCMTFGSTMADDGVGIIELYIPAEELTELIKSAEFNSDFIMAFVIIAIFGILFIVTRQWITALEKSVDYLKLLAKGEIPEEPLSLGKRARNVGLMKEINEIREEKRK